MKGQALNFKEIGFRKPVGATTEKHLTVSWRDEYTLVASTIAVYEIIDGKPVNLDPDMVKPNDDLRGYVFSYNPSYESHEYVIKFLLNDDTEVEHIVMYESGSNGEGGLKTPGTEGDVMIPVKPA